MKTLVGESIRTYLENKGLQQQDVANRLGISQSAVSAYYRGNPFGKNAAQKWSNEFGFRVNWLLTGEGSMLKEPHEEIPAPSQGGQADAIVELLKEQNAELQAKVDALNQRIGELQALLKKEREEIAGAAGSSFSADAV